MESTLESKRKQCLQQQSELRRLMTACDQFEKAMGLFLEQHTRLHSAGIAKNSSWSFEDAVLNDMTEAQVRTIPDGAEHSVAWLLWHMARCEDITMNLLVAGSPQVLLQKQWLKRTKSRVRDTGNAMSAADIAGFSEAVDLRAVRGYRLAVGQRTQEIARKLVAADLKRRVDPARLQTVLDEGAVVAAAGGILEYWGRSTTAGLLLMPATRHNLIHLNEALKLKRRLQREAGEQTAGGV